ncbi:hypothetical protein ABZ826_23745 [Streptomyces sp. NPDC047515]|uniref:hypothetical protein n=1 Tax=Streptomyces sp. NPDC047515 TaxID=3155380 RepID=UPI0033EC8DA2
MAAAVSALDPVFADSSHGHDFQLNDIPEGWFCEACHLPMQRWAGGPCPGSPGIFPPGVMK